MATLYEWRDHEDDTRSRLELGVDGIADSTSPAVATLIVNVPAGPSVYLTRKQTKKLRRALKRALAADLHN